MFEGRGGSCPLFKKKKLTNEDLDCYTKANTFKKVST